MVPLLLPPMHPMGLFLALSFLSSMVYGCYNLFLHPLRKVPGPLLAALSPFWQIYHFLGSHQHLEHIKLHEKYGHIVRVSPNTVIINDSTYFAEWSNWDKADWWLALRADPVHLAHSNYHDVKEHSRRKKLIMGGYQLSAILKNESTMDKHILTWTDQLQARVGTVIDFAPFTQYAAFDIVMDMVFSKPLGFLATASDVDGVISSLHGLLTSANIMALLPVLSKIIFTPWIFRYLAPKHTDKTGPGKVHGLAYAIVRQRYKDLQESAVQHNDILQWIIDKNNPDSENGPMPWPVLEQESLGPILAGSDSVAAHLRAVVLYVSTNPRVLVRLRAEIDAADEKGALSKIPQFQEVRKHVPYVDLIMKEAMRIYPIVGSPLPKEVPKAGTVINGYFIPGGTSVGISQWAVTRNKEIFGDDVEVFRPERWEDATAAGAEAQDALDEIETESRYTPSETPDEEEAKRRLRDSGYVPFSLGPMMCTGRNIATMEIYKITTQLFRLFDFQIVNAIQPWKEANKMAMVQWDFFVKVTERA